jgi:hypothetical protein
MNLAVGFNPRFDAHYHLVASATIESPVADATALYIPIYRALKDMAKITTSLTRRVQVF